MNAQMFDFECIVRGGVAQRSYFVRAATPSEARDKVKRIYHGVVALVRVVTRRSAS
jgi:hypothetical protein